MKSCKEFAHHYKEILRTQLEEMVGNAKEIPQLAIIQVGDDPASNSYIKGKMKDCNEIGLQCVLHKLPETASEDNLGRTVYALSNNKNVYGIIIQLPIPARLNLENAQGVLVPEKDVDGFKYGSPYEPCTPYGIMTYLDYNNVNIDGANVVIIGRSDIVGKPLARMMTERNATVTLCHSHTKDITQFTKTADIIVVAVGKEKFLTADMIGDNKPIIIDVGINKNAQGKLCGDVDYDNVISKCTDCTPVPGGIGLITRTMLLANTIKAISERKSL